MLIFSKIFFSQRFFNVLGPDDMAMSEVMVDLWYNFAKFHNPTPHSGQEPEKGVWKKASKKRDQNYVLLKDGEIKNAQDPELDKRLKFWRDVVQGKRVIYRW